MSYSTRYTGPITKRRDCSFGGGAGTKGDCFSVMTNAEIEKTASCFSLSTFDRPCFYIKCSEFYDEMIAPDEVDLGDIGFMTVKCVQSHGLNKLIVVGTIGTISEPIDVLASVDFTPATDGGVFSLKGTYFSVPLSSFDTVEFGEVTGSITLSSVERIEAYDPIVGGDDFALVLTDNRAIWVEDVLLTEKARQADAGSDPFYGPDTYGISGFSEQMPSWPTVYVNEYYNPYSMDYLSFDPQPEFCWYIDPLKAISYSPLFSNTERAHKYIITKKRSDSSNHTTSDSSIFNTPITMPSYILATDKTARNTSSFTLDKKRKYFSILNDGSGNLYLFKNLDLLSSVYIMKHLYYTSSYPSRIFTIWDWCTGAVLNPSEANSILTGIPSNYVKANIGSRYFTASSGTDMYYYELNGTKSGTVENAKNSTSVGNVAIVADGTSIIKQIVLDDL